MQLRQAAHRAGLGQPRLVEAPVAAAEHLLAAGQQFHVGALLLVCDVGGGCEVSVLRRGPTGFEVLSTLHDPDAGGARLDALLLDALGGMDARVRAATLNGAAWSLTASVRAAREALSQQLAVTVPLLPSIPPVRRAVALAVPAAASLLMIAQFLLTASLNNGTRLFHRPGFYVLANWGELTLAALFATLGCLCAGTLLGSPCARRTGRPATGAAHPDTLG